MRTITAPAVLLTLALAGCVGRGGDSPTPTAPDGEVFAHRISRPDHEPRPRALSGRCEATFAPPQPVSPGVIRQVDTGYCQITHLGRVAFSSTKEINVVAGTQTTVATFTKRNGDELRSVGSGTSAPSGPGRVRFAARSEFTGGTGRFEGATGRTQVTGEANLVDQTSALTLEGWIAYDK
jgi:hypothetical protein